MARLAEQALRASVEALTQGDRRRAYSVILRDQFIDERETELDRLCLEFLVRHQPAGAHLRLVFTTIHANRELERIGDYAESIARQALMVGPLAPQPAYARITELGQLAIQMLGGGVRAFLAQDADLARQTMASEERANALRTAINAELIEADRLHRLPPAALTPLMTVARRLERTADQVKNLCEDTLYLSTGEVARHKGAEGVRILFYDTTNACLGQMAEAIGNSIGAPRIQFCSAGYAPRPVDPRAIEFMAAKGIDISRQASKALDQLPRWEQCQVIIALGPEAVGTLPAHSNKTIVLEWAVAEPAQVTGPAEAWKAAFEAAARVLESDIRALTGAILADPDGSPTA